MFSYVEAGRILFPRITEGLGLEGTSGGPLVVPLPAQGAFL